MEDLVRNGVVFGAVLVLAALLWRTRWRLHGLALAAVSTVALGAWLGVVSTGWQAGAPLGPLALLVAWIGFTRLAASAGGPVLRGPAWVVAPLLGALVGDWGAALLLVPLAPSPSVAGRWVLAAMAGAMISTHGTAALLVLAPTAALAWLPLAAWAIAAPPGRVQSSGSAPVTAVVLGVGIAAWARPDLALWGVAAGAGLLAPLAGREALRTLGRDVVALGLLAAVAWVARHSGVLNELRWALDQGVSQGGALGTAAVTAVAALGASICGEVSLALIAAGALDTAAAPIAAGAVPALAVGLTLGGVGPLLLTGTVRPALLRWGLTVLAGVSWSAWTLQ